MEVGVPLQQKFVEAFAASSRVNSSLVSYKRTLYLELTSRRALQVVQPGGRSLATVSVMQPEFSISTTNLISSQAGTCGTGSTAACGTSISSTQAQCCLATTASSTTSVNALVAVLTDSVALPLMAQIIGTTDTSAVQATLVNAVNTNFIANSVATSFLPNYATPTPYVAPFTTSSTTKSGLDGGSIAGIVIGAVFLASAIICIFCLCTRRLVWRWAPTSNGQSQSLEVVCIPRDPEAAKRQIAARSPPAPAGSPSRTGAAMTVRDPAATAQAGAAALSSSGALGSARSSTGAAPSPPRTTTAPSVPSTEAAITTPKSFMDAAAKQGGDMKAVLAALAANPALASSVDEATGITAVMKAIRGKDVGVVKAILAAYPAGVNVADKNGATPLHHAVVYQNLEIISVLVGAGADLNAKDVHGETQLELAKKLLKQGHHRNDLVVKALEAVNP